MSVRELRKEVSSLLTQFEAILVLTYQLSPQNRAILERVREELGTATAKRLRDLRDKIKMQKRTLIAHTGYNAPISLLLEIHRKIREDTSKVLTVPKWLVDKLFTHYDRCFPGWNSYPAHSMIPLDDSGHLEKAIWHGIYLPEAILYEDMCLAYNLAAKNEQEMRSGLPRKIQIKTQNMLLRTAILSAFYFVEAYLNGVAFDFWLRKSEKLTQDEIDDLLEWNSKRNCSRWLSFEDKVSRYPRIILRQQHPPLTESSCEELRFLLKRGKKIRDSIVHQSPKIDLKTFELNKVGNVIFMQLDDATAAVKAAIGFVRKLNDKLGEQGQDLRWLHDLGAQGLFPDEALA